MDLFLVVDPPPFQPLSLSILIARTREIPIQVLGSKKLSAKPPKKSSQMDKLQEPFKMRGLHFCLYPIKPHLQQITYP
jgi:hypothetical protein